MHGSHQSAASKLVVMVLLAMAALSGMGGYWAYNEAISQETSMLVNAARLEAKSWNRMHDMALRLASSHVQYLAKENVMLTVLENEQDEDAVQQARKRLRDSEVFFFLALTKPNGTVLVSNGYADEGTVLPDAERFRTASRSVLNYGPAFRTGYGPLIPFAVDLRSNGQVVGLLCTALKLMPPEQSSLSELIGGAELYIRDESGLIVAHKDPRRLFTRYPIEAESRWNSTDLPEQTYIVEPESQSLFRTVIEFRIGDKGDLSDLRAEIRGISCLLVALSLVSAGMLLLGGWRNRAGQPDNQHGRGSAPVRASAESADAPISASPGLSEPVAGALYPNAPMVFGGGLFIVVGWLLFTDIWFVLTFWDKTVYLGRFPFPVAAWFGYLLPSCLALLLLGFCRRPVTKDVAILALVYNTVIACAFAGGMRTLGQCSYRLPYPFVPSGGSMEGLLFQYAVLFGALILCLYLRLSKRVMNLYGARDIAFPLWR